MPPASVHHRPSTEGEAALPRLYRPEEIAEALGCSAWWVKDRARRSLIPHTRVGRAYRFTAEHLAEIVRLHEARPTRSADNAAAAPAAATPPAARARASQSRRPPTASTAGRLRARPPRRTQYDTVA
ncbi:helix-turn-helix domain-containing protein [Streptomyces blattellae]|uniref:helix-turn-helix domain-containing protein n=1 Tax=Streptomyces blattellae TaxID=2569855 RepID=UPI0018AD0E1A|nr:helix-turn-helix domain-containing protein [Streptomyces blattellae]